MPDKSRSDALKRQAVDVGRVSVEAQQAAVRAEKLLNDLEDRDARRTARTQAEAARLLRGVQGR